MQAAGAPPSEIRDGDRGHSVKPRSGKIPVRYSTCLLCLTTLLKKNKRPVGLRAVQGCIAIWTLHPRTAILDGRKPSKMGAFQ